MTWVTIASLVLGSVLSGISGLVCFMGGASLVYQLDWLPGAEIFLNYPISALLAGVAMLIVGVLSQPGLRVR